MVNSRIELLSAALIPFSLLSKLILGTVQFGLQYGINNHSGLLREDEVHKILNRAAELGVKALDTAAAYGEAEQRIGAFHQNKEWCFNIISKFSKNKNEDWKNSFSRSLEQLHIKSLETIMFHSFDSFQSNKTNLEEILELKGEKYRKLGVSVYTNDELNSLRLEDDVDVIQMPFNMLDNEVQRGQVLRELKGLGKEIHTRSCFLQGLFFMDVNKLTGNLSSLKSHLNKIRSLVIENNLEIGHFAMQYALNKEYIDAVLFGVDSVDQLEQNISWSNKPIPEEILKEIDNIKVEETNLLNPSKWQI